LAGFESIKLGKRGSLKGKFQLILSEERSILLYQEIQYGALIQEIT
jgi:hypothetical protein